MKLHKHLLAAVLAGLLALGAVACDTGAEGEDPLVDDTGAPTGDTMTEPAASPTTP